MDSPRGLDEPASSSSPRSDVELARALEFSYSQEEYPDELDAELDLNATLPEVCTTKPTGQRQGSGRLVVPAIVFLPPPGVPASPICSVTSRSSRAPTTTRRRPATARSVCPTARSAWEREREDFLGLRSPRTARPASPAPPAPLDPPQRKAGDGQVQVQHDGDNEERVMSRRAAIVCLLNMFVSCSLLAYPWCFAHAGIVPGTLITLGIAGVSAATSSVVLDHGQRWGTTNYANLCGAILGPNMRRLFLTASIVSHIGYAWSYHVFITSSATDILRAVTSVSQTTVAVVAGLVLFVPYMARSLHFFVRAREVGAVGVAFVAWFVLYTSFTQASALNGGQRTGIEWFRSEFSLAHYAPLTGVMCGKYMIHHCVLPTLKEKHLHKHYLWFTCMTGGILLTIFGVVPNLFVNADVLRSNQVFLTAFPQTDLLASIARAVVVVQLFLGAPWCVYLGRLEFFGALLGREDARASFPAMLTFTACISGLSLLVVLAVPGYGDIIRWIGAVFGCVLSYTLPLLVRYAVRVQEPEPGTSWTSQLLADLSGLGVFCLGVFIVGLQVAASV